MTVSVLKAFVIVLAASLPSVGFAQTNAGAEATPDTADGLSLERVARVRAAEVHLAEGRRLYNELDFSGCIHAMQRALATANVTVVQQLEALELLGAAHIVLDQEAEAERAVRMILEIDPYHVVREPSGSPKIERYVEHLRHELVPDAALDSEVRIRSVLPEAARSGGTMAARFEVRGFRGDGHLVVHWRSDEDTNWRSVVVDGAQDDYFAELEIPSFTGNLEIYAVLRNHEDHVVARAGSPLLPLRVAIREDAEAAVAARRRRIAGVVAAVLIAGAAVALYFGLARPDEPPNGSLPPGQVQLPLIRF